MDKWLGNNNVVKAVAVVIAVLLWFVVQLETRPSTGASTPALREITINNVSVLAAYDEERYSISMMDPLEVTVVLQGRDSAIRRVKPQEIRVEVDLTSYSPDQLYYPLQIVNLPGGISASLLPDRVKVMMEELQMKEVPVIITTTGTPEEGFKAGQPIVNPNRVHVTVPTSLLEEVDSARAEISVEGASATVKQEVKLTAYDKDGNPIEGSKITPAVVDVEVPVTSPFKVMPLQVRLTGQPAAGYSVASVEQSVRELAVYAHQSVLDRMEFYEGPVLDLTGLAEPITVELDIPLRNDVLQLEHRTVELTVDIVPSETRPAVGIPIVIAGETPNYQVTLIEPQPPVVDVMLTGAPSRLNALRIEELQAVVDVSNLAPGIHDLPITLQLPLFITGGADLRAIVEITESGASPTPGTPTPAPEMQEDEATDASPLPAEPTPAAPASGAAPGDDAEAPDEPDSAEDAEAEP